jgi:hypothetical protein
VSFYVARRAAEVIETTELSHIRPFVVLRTSVQSRKCEYIRKPCFLSERASE